MTEARDDRPAPGEGDGERLAKAVAALKGCSRREAEQYITEGHVRVDGERVEAPQARVRPGQRVEVDPQARLLPPVSATFLLHKPEGLDLPGARALLAAAARWDGDSTGIRRSRSHEAGLQPLLPLPAPASGLCVFSQDFRVIRKLTQDAALVEQELVARVQGSLAPEGLARLARGLVHEGRPLPPARVSWQSEGQLRFAVKGLDPSWIPWMCTQVGLKLTALRRLRIGRVALAGLPPGQWRYLGPGERF